MQQLDRPEQIRYPADPEAGRGAGGCNLDRRGDSDGTVLG
jgi:hypothetical protein